MGYHLPLRPAAALLSKRALKANLKLAQSLIKEKPVLHRRDAKVMAMVKADAYGHDIALILPELENQGVSNFAVASLEEGLEARRLTRTAKILVLGGTFSFDESLIPLLRSQQLQIAVSDLKALKFFSKHPEIPIHLSLDTGMNRLGFRPDAWGEAIQLLKRSRRKIEGIYTHYATSQDEIFHRQAFLFQEGVRWILSEGFTPRFIHSENSAAILGKNKIKKGILSEVVNLVRPGISLYGYFPRKIDAKQHFTPVLELVAEVGLVKRAQKGEGISYGHLYKAKSSHDYGIATLGYADGLSKAYAQVLQPQWRDRSGRLKGLLNICGAICMDMVMVRVARRMMSGARLEAGDRVVFWGRFPNRVLQNKIVEPYELNLRISKRIPRIWTA